MKKAELLENVTKSRAEFEALMAQFSDDQMLAPVLPGGWSAKDALAHIAWWARRAYVVINASKNGLEPEYSLDEADVDNVNLKTYDAYRSRPLDDIRREEAESYQALLALVEKLSDDDLDNPSKFPWTNGSPLSVLVEWNTFGHYDEHKADLQKVLGK